MVLWTNFLAEANIAEQQKYPRSCFSATPRAISLNGTEDSHFTMSELHPPPSRPLPFRVYCNLTTQLLDWLENLKIHQFLIFLLYLLKAGYSKLFEVFFTNSKWLVADYCLEFMLTPNIKKTVKERVKRFTYEYKVVRVKVRVET